MPEVVVSGISSRFRGLSRCEGQIAHVLLTRSPLVYSRRSLTARLACVKHAASVRPEPGSNSPLNSCDSDPEATVNSWCFYPGKRTITDYCQNHRLSYQRNRRRRIPDTRPVQVSRTGIINSSTFGTLLSSQGSSAHRGQASRPFQGATCKNLPGPTRGVKSAWPVPAPSRSSLCLSVPGPPKRAPGPPRLRCSVGVVDRPGRSTSRSCVLLFRPNEVKH